VREPSAIVTEDGATLSFADLERRASRSPFAFPAPATLPALLHVLDHLRARTPFFPLHPRLTTAEQAALLAAVEDHDDDTLAVIATSGTTGEPRAIPLGRAAFHAAAAASAAHLAWRDDDRWLLCLPLAHVGGLGIAVRCLLARRTIVLGEPTLENFTRREVTLASLVPTQLHRLVATGAPAPPRLRAVLVGGAAASPALVTRARALGWPVRLTYGLTEACGQVATQRDASDDPSCGPPLPTIAVRIGEKEHIEILGPTVPGGLLRTSDLGRLDDTGRLHVLGRSDDIIITAGENVHPLEIERCLLELPGLAAACVFGVPDAEYGRVLAAALVPTSPADTVTSEAVAAHLATRLASFKRPRRLAWLDALPTTRAGKPDRTATAATATPRLRPIGNLSSY
jgi:O-succinylbenzoic acid--CoA ligase